jgi:hypothetical protein
MEEQTNEDKTDGVVFYKSHSKDIYRNGIFCMQWVKPNPAPVGIKKRICKHVVYIYSHRRKEDQPVALPVLFVVPVSDGAYENEVEEVVGEGLHGRVMSYGVMSYEFFVRF